MFENFGEKIYNALKDDALLISMDCYYKNNEHLPFEERVKTNYDHPNAFDSDLLVSHLIDLKCDRSIDYPTYDFTTHSRKDEWIHATPKKVIIVEGIMLFAIPEIVKLLDIKIFVDTDADVRILRRIVRDVSGRGRSLESVIEQYLSTVKPMHEAFVEPTRRYADLVIPEGGGNPVAYGMIVEKIEKHIKSAK